MRFQPDKRARSKYVVGPGFVARQLAVLGPCSDPIEGKSSTPRVHLRGRACAGLSLQSCCVRDFCVRRSATGVMSFVTVGGDGSARPTFFELVAAERLMPSLKAAAAYSLSVSWLKEVLFSSIYSLWLC